MYEFYIAGERLPITPSELSISHGSNIEQIDLANGSKLTRYIGTDLVSISFEATFPFFTPLSTREGAALCFPNYVYSGMKSPYHYLDKFRSLMSTKEPFELLIVQKIDGTHVDSRDQRALKIDVYLESMEESYSAEDGSELNLAFDFVQWKELSTLRIQTGTIIDDVIEALQLVSRLGLDTSSIPAEIEVGDGETLQSLTQKYYKTSDSSISDRLLEMNPTLKSSIHTIPQGTKIKLL